MHAKEARLAVVLLCALSATAVRADLWVTDDKAEFVARAGTASMESFEGIAASTTMNYTEIPASSLSNHFRVTTNRFMQVWDSLATDGANVLFWHTYTSPPYAGTATVTFDDFGGTSAAINTFGLQIIDWGSGDAEGILTLRTNAGDSVVVAVSPPHLAGYNTFFFGVVSDTPFTSVSLESTTDGDWVFHDEVYYGSDGTFCPVHEVGDIIDFFDNALVDVSVCESSIAGVQVDTDEDGTSDTQVVFETLTGEAAVIREAPGSAQKQYYWSQYVSGCNPPDADRGRLQIRFVDMLAGGFVADQPATWTYTRVPRLSIRAWHDWTSSSGSPYQLVQAYRDLNQTNGIAGAFTSDDPCEPVISCGGTYEFDDVTGIRELYVTSDYAENALDEFYIKSAPCSSPVYALITGFESITGAEIFFRVPRYSSMTSGHLDLSPNISTVTNEVPAAGGVQSCKLSWKFIDGSLIRWVQCTTFNAGVYPNPTIELDKPVRVRLRVYGPPGASLRVCMAVRETNTSAPVGANGGTTGTIEFVGASSVISGAPQGRHVYVNPNQWQEVVFNPAVDPIVPFTGDGILTTQTGKGVLEALAFASTGSSGPFTVYVDDIAQLKRKKPAIVVPGDYDTDGDSDLVDFSTFVSCFNGPNRPAAQPSCAPPDADHDGDVDSADFGVFLSCFNGPNRPPACV